MLKLSAVDDRISIAYSDDTNLTLKYASHNETNSWSTVVAATTLGGASFMSMDYDADNQPTISYHDAHTSDLKLAYLPETADTFETSTLLSNGTTGLYSNLYFEKESVAPMVWSWNRSSDRVTAVRQSLPLPGLPLS